MSPQGQREPEVLVLTCFEPRQQSQRIVTADALEDDKNVIPPSCWRRLCAANMESPGVAPGRGA